MLAVRIACAALAALVWSGPGLAQPSCELAETVRRMAVDVQRFESQGPRRSVEEIDRLLVPSPCETSLSPALSLATADIALAMENWRQETRELDRDRFER
jgi:hypothetical protein